MRIENNLLINELLDLTERSIISVMKFKELNIDRLNYKRSSEEWSILECIEHLNLYGDFYLPEIERKIVESRKGTSSTVFQSSILGNYFASLMQVNNGSVKKMKSPKDKNPANSKLTVTTLDRFLKQAEKLRSLLNQARPINLTRTRTAISLTKFIKLRLGDTFRFFVFHIERHITQAERMQSAKAGQNKPARMDRTSSPVL